MEQIGVRLVKTALTAGFGGPWCCHCDVIRVISVKRIHIYYITNTPRQTVLETYSTLVVGCIMGNGSGVFNFVYSH